MNTLAMWLGYIFILILGLGFLAVAIGVAWLGIQCAFCFARNKRFYRIMFRHQDETLACLSSKYLIGWKLPTNDIREICDWFEGHDQEDSINKRCRIIDKNSAGYVGEGD